MQTETNSKSLTPDGGSFWALMLTSLTIVLGVGLSASLVWASGRTSICSNASDLKVIQNKANYKDLSELPRMVGRAQLVLIGEVHRTHYAFRRPLLTQLRATRPGKACLFYELNRESSIQEHLESFSIVGFEEVKRHIGRVHTLAKELGFKEFTVDTESSPEDISVNEINRRDREMADRIASLLQTECDSAVMFVGKAHVVNERRGRVNLGQQLKALRVSTQVINLQDPNDDRMAQIWSPEEAEVVQAWNGVCKKGKSLPRPKKPVIFLNQKLTAERLIFPRTDEKGTWQSFDFTILAADPDLQ